MADDSDLYQENARYETTHPECLSDNITNNPDPESAYWRARDLATHAGRLLTGRAGGSTR